MKYVVVVVALMICGPLCVLGGIKAKDDVLPVAADAMQKARTLVAEKSELEGRIAELEAELRKSTVLVEKLTKALTKEMHL